MVWKWVIGWVTSLAKDWVLKPLTTAVSIIFMWTFHAAVKSSPGRAFDIMRVISSAYFTPPTEWAAFISTYMEQMTGSKIELTDIISSGAGGASRAATEKLGEAFVTPLLNLIMPQPPITPLDGVDAAERYLGVNLQFQMSSWFMHVLGDMMSFGIFKSLKDLPNAISWSFGLGWLSWLVMGTPFQMGIADPLREHFNRVYKPSRYSVSQNFEAYRRGLISNQEMVDNLRYLGWDDTKIQQLYTMARKDLTDASLVKLYNLGIIDQNDVYQEVSAKGYTAGARDSLVWIITNDRLLDLRDDLVKEMEKQYVEGEITAISLRDAYSRAGWKSNEVDMAIQIFDSEKSRKSLLSNTDVANAVEKGFIGHQEAMTTLRSRGFTARDAEHFIKLRIPQSMWW